MAKVLITFGQIHTHRINGHTLDKDCVAVINCKDYAHGRELAFKWFDGVFHNCYLEGEEPANLMDYYPRGKIEIN